METFKGLRLIEEVEKRLERTYRTLARRFKEADPEASEFFHQMSRDEHTHLELARMEMRMVRSAGVRKGHAVMDEAEVRRVLAMADRLIEEELPLDETLHLLHDIEASPAELYAKTALEKGGDPAVSKLLATMGETFRLHRESVREFLEGRGIDTADMVDEDRAAPRAPRKRTALLVSSAKSGEDELQAYASSVRAAGYEVTTVLGPGEAKENMTEAQRTDLVLIDSESEDAPNFAFIRAARKMSANALSLVLSTHYDVTYKRKAAALGANGLMHKMSMSPEKLLKLLKGE